MYKTKNYFMENFFFYSFWLILLIGKGLGFTASSPLFQKMTWIAIGFAFIKLLMTRWDKKSLIICVLLNSLGILILLFSHETAPLLTSIAITSSKDIDIHKLLKVSFWIKMVFFLVVTSLAILGYIDNQEGIWFSGIIRVRYGLGYGHPNSTHYTLFIIVSLCILIYHNKMNLFHYAVLFGYNYFIYRYTFSRTGFYLTILILILSYFSDKKFGKYILKSSYWICDKAYLMGCFLSIALCLYYSQKGMGSQFDTAVSRFLTGFRIINSNRLNLFGTYNIDTDLGYIKILYGHGLIALIILILGLTKLMKLMKNYQFNIELIILIVYSLYTFMEAATMSILMNLSLIFLSFILYPINLELYIHSKKPSD